jgi:O-methyltransferase
MFENVKSTAVYCLGSLPWNGSISKIASWAKFSRWTVSRRLFCDFTGDIPREMYFEELVRKEDLTNRPSTFLEFGVFRGESISWWSRNLKHPKTRLVGFDSFAGLPEDWTEAKPAGTFSTAGQLPRIDDNRVSFHKGVFQATLHPFLASFRREEKMIVHLDADLYSSTVFVLMSLGPILKAGDILMFDEFSDPRHEFRAFSDFLDTFTFSFDVAARTKSLNKVSFRLC